VADLSIPDQEAPARLLVTGGRQAPSGARRNASHFDGARMVALDARSGAPVAKADHATPRDRRGPETSLRFGAATRVGDLVYTCTGTEALSLDATTLAPRRAWSHPLMNSAHHALPGTRGGVAVASTGVDMVLELDDAGEPIRIVDLGDGEARRRFPEVADFRAIGGTKPHRCHVNFLFRAGDALFATRFNQRDAVNLDDPADRFEIAAAGPHDGVVHDKRVHFTLVDGRVAIFDLDTRRKLAEVRLKDDGAPLGWCRGLLPFGRRHAWIGFSRLRPTRIAENVAWAMEKLGRQARGATRPTRLALYDLFTGEPEREILLEPHGIHAVYGLVRHG
jgi:hypothetical protein